MTSALSTRIFEPRRGRQVIERRAWKLLERCRAKLGLDEIPLPIPVDEWIESPLGLRFGFTDLSNLGEDVLGAAHVADREILIDERVLQHQGRFRFTCAHELGHVVLHRNVQSVFHETGYNADLSSPDYYERQADQFAAAFLMPVPLLEQELTRIFDACGLKKAKAVMELMEPSIESEWLWRKIVLPRITRRFDVSYAAAVHRFHDIRPKLPDSEPLLPWDLTDRLLQPACDRSSFDELFIENGVVSHRPTFFADADAARR